jgi:hypothetical protein
MAALAGCSAGKATPAADPHGAVQARIATAPTGVLSVLITVEGAGIDVPMRTALTKDLDGNWSGRVVNVPPGLGRVVTAYAYDHGTPPADPVGNVTGLVYRGSKNNVAVTAGRLAFVPVVLLPYPDGGGGTGINTPPHITGVVHAVSIASDATTTFTATALDPDAPAMLSYQWSDDAGGTFSELDGLITNQLPGEPVAIDYTPPFGLVGTVTIRLDVFDGTATATTTFPVAIGSGVDIGLTFDVLPLIDIVFVQDQALLPGASTDIAYELSYPAGAGPEAPPVLDVTATWTDTCGGSFSQPPRHYLIFRGEPPRFDSVIYQAPATAPAAPGRCDLVLTLVDGLGATVWSGLIVWVEPVVTGRWSGPAVDAVRGAYTFTFELSQSGSSVSGSYTTSFGGQGTLFGSIAGTLITFSVDVLNPQCFGALTGTASVDLANTEMTVAYSGATDCGGPTTGTGTLARTLASKVIFVTSTAFGANLGGLAGGDARCQEHADYAAMVGSIPHGTYRALLSDGVTDAVDRIVDGFFVLPNGTPVAATKGELFNLDLSHAIDMTELRSPYGGVVWTGSNAQGRAYDSCNGFTSSFPGNLGGIGRATALDFGWITDGVASCDQDFPLYCVQQTTSLYQ